MNEAADAVVLSATCAAVFLPSLFLAALAIVTALPARRRAGRPSGIYRFAVFIAAHNEERSIQATIGAVQRDAGAGITVHVVADNCADATAAVAEAAGACVHERTDAVKKGKGAALNWLAGQVFHEDQTSQAFVIIDADTQVEAGFFEAIR